MSLPWPDGGCGSRVPMGDRKHIAAITCEKAVSCKLEVGSM